MLGVVLVWLTVIVLDALGLFDTSGQVAGFIVIGATVFALEGVLEHRRRLAGGRATAAER